MLSLLHALCNTNSTMGSFKPTGACTHIQSMAGKVQGCKETHFELTTRFFTMSDSLHATNFHKRGLVGILQNYHCPLHQSQDSYNLVFRGIQLSGKKKKPSCFPLLSCRSQNVEVFSRYFFFQVFKIGALVAKVEGSCVRLI
jgi:hypothetical protein